MKQLKNHAVSIVSKPEIASIKCKVRVSKTNSPHGKFNKNTTFDKSDFRSIVHRFIPEISGRAPRDLSCSKLRPSLQWPRGGGGGGVTEVTDYFCMIKRNLK